MNLTTHQCDHAGSCSFVTHSNDVDACHVFEQLAREVRGRAECAGSVVELARPRLREGDQLPDGFHVKGRMNDEHAR